MFFKVIVACGHVGRGREIEVTRYFQAESVFDAWESALHMPRAKKGHGGRCVRKIEKINLMQYLSGKIAEAENPYLKVSSARTKINIEMAS